MLFAIIILGIGMIMLAAMLPVAISQTALARDQIAGKAAAETGYAFTKSILLTSGSAAFPATGNPATPQFAGIMQPASGITTPVATPGLDRYVHSRILSGDPAVQWIPFYRRDPASSIVKFVFLATRLSSNELAKAYDASTLSNETRLNTGAAGSYDMNPTIGLNGPHLYAVRVVDGDSNPDAALPDRIQFFEEGSRNTPIDPAMAAAGAYVIIREQNSADAANADPQISFRNNGRIFKLASKVEGTIGLWDLSPDFDLQPIGLGPDGVNGSPDDIADYTLDPGNSQAPSEIQSLGAADRATAWIIGKAATDPTGSTGSTTFTGVAQDIGILQVEIPIN